MRRTSETKMTRVGHGSESLHGLQTRGLAEVFDGMERMMEETFANPFRRFGLVPFGDIFRGVSAEIVPPLDLFEDGGHLVARTELPGMKREEIDVSITGNLLVISGEKRAGESKEGKGYLRRETSHGSIRRTVTLPETVDPESATASFRDGILEIRMKKSGAEGVRHISIH